ncbi:MAG: LPS export ABC transporter periplasmic protein LptC [Gallionellales bacterium RIFCSPLOWO2_12_FULL_59_22]|nr:MAG: LPS export ABC transporter periplasmic protein LptC [Gallionellales bacterium RIFCSPLOWO2_02_FULL_59_110]OGT01283.1 MAG: LPS export ABC transporter periplasmic protein LptC [Gallionellales bacterium RIFCSPLOWO2_02_58_13]OGT14152.1 MAG: LPS export ABC transporter periplasmic protein LptC [Gallionellales bacterium RIFCSPLOWO2_12_FULL_59_22]
MVSRARHWLPLLPLLGLLGVTYWLSQQVRPEDGKPDNGKRHDPDAIMENFSAVRLNEQGMPRFIMSAKKMQHYPDDDSTLLEVPRLTALSAGHPAIHLIAKRGIVSSKGDEIYLHDDVEVLREADVQQSELTLHTEFLHVVPDRDWAETDHAVTVVNARNTMHAVGLEMDNKARTLKLLSQVRSEHAKAN